MQVITVLKEDIKKLISERNKLYRWGSEYKTYEKKLFILQSCMLYLKENFIQEDGIMLLRKEDDNFFNELRVTLECGDCVYCRTRDAMKLNDYGNFVCDECRRVAEGSSYIAWYIELTYPDKHGNYKES